MFDGLHIPFCLPIGLRVPCACPTYLNTPQLTMLLKFTFKFSSLISSYHPWHSIPANHFFEECQPHLLCTSRFQLQNFNPFGESVNTHNQVDITQGDSINTPLLEWLLAFECRCHDLLLVRKLCSRLLACIATPNDLDGCVIHILPPILILEALDNGMSASMPHQHVSFLYYLSSFGNAWYLQPASVPADFQTACHAVAQKLRCLLHCSQALGVLWVQTVLQVVQQLGIICYIALSFGFNFFFALLTVPVPLGYFW